MTELQSEKDCVRAFFAELEAAAPGGSVDVLTRFCAPDLHWRGVHPLNEMTGPTAVARAFWQPLKAALTGLQRRMDVFMAGQNSLDPGGAVWVVSMGHLTGLFDAPWLGIQPTGKLAMLRYAEFHRVEAGLIVETAMFVDVPALMMQAGLQPFPVQTGAQLVQPGPRTHDGLMFTAQDAAQGAMTLAVINRMIGDLGQWQSGLSLEEELARTWQDDMIWWGPAGIGATATIARYAKQHAGPFRAGFAERSGTGHLCRFAEGRYDGFFGWPNFTARPTGGFMGMPATGKAGEFRVVDIYRRDGDKLAENWVFIDLLHFWKTQGVDILARTVGI